MFSPRVLNGVLMFYLFLYSVFYLQWLSHVSYIQPPYYNILSCFDSTGLKLHHASFVFSAQVIFYNLLILLLHKPDGLYVWLIIKKRQTFKYLSGIQWWWDGAYLISIYHQNNVHNFQILSDRIGVVIASVLVLSAIDHGF